MNATNNNYGTEALHRSEDGNPQYDRNTTASRSRRIQYHPHKKSNAPDNQNGSTPNTTNTNAASTLSEKERIQLQKQYLGTVTSASEAAPDDTTAANHNKKNNQHRASQSSRLNFKFEWDEEEDTVDKDDPLYSSMIAVPQTARRNTDSLLHTSTAKRQITSLESVQKKPLEQMTTRDWRILRENYEIIVKGGKAPPPLRTFRECPAPNELPSLHPVLLDAIENVLGFQNPSPIQRQAIPIGLQRRDMIGIAETGSGKTVAFGLPLCNYLLGLPLATLQNVSLDGPLAIVLAPTRELALQIESELSKLLSLQSTVKSTAVVGGQDIHRQAQALRNGVHIVVGTPGRLNDCLERSFMVLNQCCYIVLDEADRMLDMGFQAQVENILEAMGGRMKADDEQEAYRQEMEDLKRGGVASHRVTALFSATMPAEVEQLARQYMRYPAIVSIGDRDSRKNHRIVQKVMFLSSPAQKDVELRKIMQDRRFYNEKIIVFVNEKKHTEAVARVVERSGRTCVVLHGGKSQEQREENLERFRRGGVVMVATDVLGRGIDIENVAHVINYDLPTRSIENYTHRIGRTGRAGKDGLATSFITDEDTGIMPDLVKYLKSTKSRIPERLARHEAVEESGGNIIN